MVSMSIQGPESLGENVQNIVSQKIWLWTIIKIPFRNMYIYINMHIYSETILFLEYIWLFKLEILSIPV